MAFANRRAAGRQLGELVRTWVRDHAAAGGAKTRDAEPRNAAPGDTAPGDIEPGDAEPGDIEPGDAEPGGAQSAGAEPGGAEFGDGVVVVGLPRGGVPVAYEVAEALSAPLDVVVVRKLGVPSQPELAMGAVAEGGVRVVDERAVRAAGLDDAEFDALVARERLELDDRARRLRRGRSRVDLTGRTVVVVDDGIATGATAVAACQVVRALGAARVVLAAPVAPVGHLTWLLGHADDVVCVAQPQSFFAVGQFYLDFSQTPDDEVVELLDRAARHRDGSQDVAIPVAPPTVATRRLRTHRDQRDQRDQMTLPGRLTVPQHARGVVVVVHGTGSGRDSPRNRAVAAQLHPASLATLLFDLHSPQEIEAGGAGELDVEVLGRRLLDVSGWLRDLPELAGLPLSYFGASTGAGLALWAAAEPGAEVAAVVSRGGRPDLAADRLASVHAPTLFVVGENDELVRTLARQAQAAMTAATDLVVVEGASHLFAEPGAIDTVAALARDWLLRHLPVTSTTGPAGPPDAERLGRRLGA